MITCKLSASVTVAAVFCVVTVFANPSWAKPTCKERSVSELLNQLDQTGDKFAVPAYGLTIVNGDRTVYAGARGIADLKTGKPAGNDTRFRIGSITKAFTGLALAIAANDGRFKLGDKASDLIDPVPYSNPWEATNPIRLSHLLEHTSGLTDLTRDEMNYSDARNVPLRDAIRDTHKNRIANWRPGVHASYSNAGAGIAGRILELHTETSYETFVTRRIIEPLGMATASLTLDEATRQDLAIGYDTDAKSVIPYWHMLYRPFGAINLRPVDMAPFLRLMLNSGSLSGDLFVPEAVVTRMETPTSTLAARHGLRYGYGLGIYTWYRNGWLFHGHGGDGDGYLAHFGYNRDFNMGYFVVINIFRHPPIRTMRRQIEEFIACEPNKDRAERANLTQRQRERIAGLYLEATHRWPTQPGADTQNRTLRIIDDDARLFTITKDNQRLELIPVSANLFRRRHQPTATMAIVPDVDGTLVLQGDIGNFYKRPDQFETPIKP